jgi:hypothetical protein
MTAALLDDSMAKSDLAQGMYCRICPDDEQTTRRFRSTAIRNSKFEIKIEHFKFDDETAGCPCRRFPDMGFISSLHGMLGQQINTFAMDGIVHHSFEITTRPVQYS